MEKQLNISGLFHSPTHACLIGNGRLKEKDKDELMSARRDVRLALRTGLREGKVVGDGAPLSPRFFTQGSMAYKTIVHPQRPPEQQADLDDGIYLPIEYIMQEDRPTIAAQDYIRETDAILSSLATRRNWTFVSKKIAARVWCFATINILTCHVTPSLTRNSAQSLKPKRAKTT